jgi:hypothetical protein
LGSAVGIGVLHPLLGEVIAITEIAVVLTVIAVALFGSKTLSERAFRLLRWFGNRPEPPAPNLTGNPSYSGVTSSPTVRGPTMMPVIVWAPTHLAVAAR